METITSVEQLERGDRIFRIDNVGRVEIIEFLCIHPHHSGYSIFLDINQDPIKKFWNKNLAEQDWYRYDSDVWTEIYQMEIEWHLKEIEFLNIERRNEKVFYDHAEHFQWSLVNGKEVGVLFRSL